MTDWKSKMITSFYYIVSFLPFLETQHTNKKLQGMPGVL